MSSDLSLSGLASGFDWKPVVEQLIELEAIPKKRLEREKSRNEEKISDLGLLKSQLDTLKTASSNLQSDDVFEARKGTLDEAGAKFMALALDAGSMTGNYKVEVVSLGTQTAMSSKLRKPGGLGASLNVNTKLDELPLQTPISKGTFTIAGKTYEITSLTDTLADIINMVSANPEPGDGTAVTLEYDPLTDKMLVDGGQFSTDPNYTEVPILGSPTDTSNFLKVMRLLDQQSITRDADYETNSGISIWSGALSTLGGTAPQAAWLRPDDPDVSPFASDSRLYVANGGANGTDVMYRRKGKEQFYDANVVYSAGDVVYKHGYLYQMKAGKNLSNAAYAQGTTANTAGTVIRVTSGANQGFWELQTDLETLKRDDYDPSAHEPDGSAASYKQGEVVKITDGSGTHFFRAVQDRTNTLAVEWNAAALTSGGGIDSLNTGNAATWSNNRPNYVKVNGRLFQPLFTANTHAGAGDNTKYVGTQYVAGADGVANVEDQYYQAAAAWNSMPDQQGAGDTTKYTQSTVVQNVNDKKFYQATAQWSAANLLTHTGANHQVKFAKDDYVYETTGQKFYQATAAWDNVATHTGVADVAARAQNDVVWRNMTGNKYFYKAKMEFQDVNAVVQAKHYDDTAANIEDRIVKNGTGTKYYKAKTAWDNINAFVPGTNVHGGSGISQNEIVRDSGNNKFYQAVIDLQAIANHATGTNYNANDVVFSGGKYWKADQNIANKTFAGAAGLAVADVLGMLAGQRALDTANGKVFTAKTSLAAINAYSNTNNYSTNDVVESGGKYWKAKQNVAEATYGGGGLSAAALGAIVTSDRVLSTATGKVFEADENLGSVQNHDPDQAYDPASATLDDKLRKSGSNYYAPAGVINFQGAYVAGSSYTPGDGIVKDGASYYQFAVPYKGIGGGPTVNPGEWVRGSDNNYYENTSGGALTTDPALNPTGWTDSGQSTLSALAGSLVTDVTTNVTNPAAGGNTLWNDVTNDVTTPNSSNNYWTETAPPTTLAENAFWTEVTGDVKAPTATNDYWTLETDATTLANNAYWTEVTNEVNLTTKPTPTNAYWKDVSADLTNLTNVGTGGTLADDHWTEITAEISLSSPPAAGGSNDYWEDLTAELTDPANAAFTGTWWTNVTNEVTDENNGNFSTWWDDVTTKLTDLSNVGSDPLTNTYWTKVTTEMTDVNHANFGNYWQEYAHITDSTTYDSDYWQIVAPEMKRLQGTQVGTTAVDHTIWAKAGNLAASAGADGQYATHDTGEHALADPAAIAAWSAATAYSAGDLVKHNSNYYLARAGTSAGENPEGAGAGAEKWELVGNASATDADAYAFKYADAKFWEQVNTPTPGVDANWTDYWETLTETTLASSQALGAVDLSEKIKDANFSGFDASKFTANTGSFFIGDGSGAVRIDYNVEDDTVANLIDRVNKSGANVNMFYDPVGDRFVIQNKNAGAIGITVHESSTWDSLAANSGSGNVLELMGLAAPDDTGGAYGVHSDSNAYSEGDLVKVTQGSTTTYWQARESIAANSSQTPDVANSKWEQVYMGVGRAFTDELGNNYAIKVNDGELIYNDVSTFNEDTHGYKGVTFDVTKGAVGDVGTAKIEHDVSVAANAIKKFVEEFNDVQDYVNSLVAISNDGERVSSGAFSSNLEISRLSSQLRKIAFGDSNPHSESLIADDGTNITVDTKAILDQLDDASELDLGTNDAGYRVKVKADESQGGSPVAYYEWDGSAWQVYKPRFGAFRLGDVGLDFGTGSDRMQVKDASKLAEQLTKNPHKVRALFAEAPATANDLNTGVQNRKYQGITHSIGDFLDNFLNGDNDSGYKGAYQAHVESLRGQNKRIDERIEDMNRYLEQREKALSTGFIRMEEMQSKINTQMQTLQNSFKK